MSRLNADFPFQFALTRGHIGNEDLKYGKSYYTHTYSRTEPRRDFGRRFGHFFPIRFPRLNARPDCRGIWSLEAEPLVLFPIKGSDPRRTVGEFA